MSAIMEYMLARKELVKAVSKGADEDIIKALRKRCDEAWADCKFDTERDDDNG